MNIILSRTIKVTLILTVISGCAGYPGYNNRYYGVMGNQQGYEYPNQNQYGNYGYGNYQGYQQPYRGGDNDDGNRGNYSGDSYKGNYQLR